MNGGVVRVWDAFVRVAHWLLAAGFFVAYFTEDDLLTVHVWAGYLVGVIVVMRVVLACSGGRPSVTWAIVPPAARWWCCS